MSYMLSTNYLGSTSAAIQLSNGDARIYYQASDGSIHQCRSVGSAAGRYTGDHILVSADQVRFNTPMAATTWGSNFDQIRLYFVDRNNFIRELCYSRASRAFVRGVFDYMQYMAAPNSGFLYAISTPDGNPRVGFQSADEPSSITEAAFSTSVGWVSAKLA